jgi:hypothetical protein
MAYRMPEAVAPETHRRGRATARPQRLAWFIAAAVFLHLPLTPLGALIGLLSLLHWPSREPPPESLNAIPVSLLSPEEMEQLGLKEAPPAPPEAAEPKAAEEAAAEPPPVPPKPKPKPKPRPVATDGGPAAPDAGVAHPPVEHPHPMASAAGDAGAPVAGHGPAASDPLALAGKAASVADPNANVRLLLLNDRIRSLPIGPRIGQLVARLPQWRSFFGPAGLDPIRDIKGIYIAGPQFRVSAEVVVVLSYNVSQATMHKAVDGIVNHHPKGEWLDAPIPVARAHADRAERIFVLPKSKIVLMVPPHLKDDAISKAPHMAFPSVGGEAALVAFVAKPWRATMGLRVPVEIPRTIASVSLSLSPTSDGGATLHVDATDASPEAAQADAATLTQAINAVTQQNVGALGALLFGGQTLSLIEPVDLRAVDKSIRGDAKITPRQLERLVGFAEGWVDAITGGPPPPTGGVGGSPGETPRPGPSPAKKSPARSRPPAGASSR